MKLFYITLNTSEQAEIISHDLLQNQYAVCTNWFPITCAYRLEGDIKQGAEVVLIVKTQDDMREKIESLIAKHITYNNFIAEIEVKSANPSFLQWMSNEMAFS